MDPLNGTFLRIFFRRQISIKFCKIFLIILLALFSAHVWGTGSVRKSYITVPWSEIETAAETNEQLYHLFTAGIFECISSIPRVDSFHVFTCWF